MGRVPCPSLGLSRGGTCLGLRRKFWKKKRKEPAETCVVRGGGFRSGGRGQNSWKEDTSLRRKHATLTRKEARVTTRLRLIPPSRQPLSAIRASECGKIGPGHGDYLYCEGRCSELLLARASLASVAALGLRRAVT